MNKEIICVECPVGCALKVDVENCRAVRVSGNKCPKGEEYARSETEDPRRVLTSAVLAEGLAVKMVPVRTDAPVPKSRLMEAMAEIKKARLRRPVAVGDVVIAGLLGLKVNVVATRRVGAFDDGEK